MAAYNFNGFASYSGTVDADQFYLQGATYGVTVNGLAGNDYIRSGTYADTLNGGDGADFIYGGDGADTINGGDGDDVLYGGTDDGGGSLISDQAKDTLYGGLGNDILYGQSTDVGDADTLIGGPGNDIYFITLDIKGGIVPRLTHVDQFYPNIVEDNEFGVDTVYLTGSAISELVGKYEPTVNTQTDFYMPENVENIILLSDTGATYGNFTGNTIIGSNFNDTLFGLDGDDQINGGSGADHIYGGLDNDVIYGGTDFDLLYGEQGNDIIFGDTGADTMLGGPGNDIYSVENISDVVIELVEEGYDEVYASVDFALPENTETLFLTGSAVYATGNAGNNAIIGNDLDNVIDAGAGTFEFINGAGGNDILIGGAGHDEINGGAGNDVFRFTAVQDAGDFIYDFTPGQDHIQLNAAAFGIGTAANPLVAGVSFINGSDVTSAVPTLLYTQANGTLFYDADGTGAQAPVVLAILNGTPALTAADFLVY